MQDFLRDVRVSAHIKYAGDHPENGIISGFLLFLFIASERLCILFPFLHLHCKDDLNDDQHDVQNNQQQGNDH